jgi:uncharacterized membrane protein YhiD involved in acid resistance
MELTNFYSLIPTEISAAVILFNLFLSFVLLLVIVYAYKKTRHGLSYSQSFVFTVIIVGVLASAVMMAVQNNVIGAIAIFGAFTIIRFRSILKETSDLAFLFFALVVGIAVGMGHYPLALMTTAFLSAFIYLFYRFGFGSVSDNFDFLLIITADGTFALDERAKVFLAEHAMHQELLHVKHFEGGSQEVSLSLRLKENADPARIPEYFHALPTVKTVELLTGKNTSEF